MSTSSIPPTTTTTTTESPPHTHPSGTCIKTCRECRLANIIAKTSNDWDDNNNTPAVATNHTILPPDPKRPQTSSPLLLLLPPELKNKIYKLALTRPLDTTTNGKNQTTLTYQGLRRVPCPCDKCSRTQDALLLTCREIYRDAAGMPYHATLATGPLRFLGSESLLKFLHYTTPRRLQGVENLMVCLDEPGEGLEDLYPILCALRRRRIPVLKKFVVQIHFSAVLQRTGEVYGGVFRELRKMDWLEGFGMEVLWDGILGAEYKGIREGVLRLVRRVVGNVPAMRERAREEVGGEE